MNVLMTSVGRRVKLIEYFVQEWGSAGKIIAVDCDPTAPALFAAHHRQIVPRMDAPDYVQALEEICLRYDIRAVLSLIDPELGVLAAHAEQFSRLGVQAVVSGTDVVNLCLDKKATCDFLRARGLPCVPTYTLEEVRAALASGELAYPLLAKPRKGSASLGLVRIENEAELAALAQKTDELIVQTFLQAEEYGVDGYVDLVTGELTTLFTRKKIRMRAGETDRSLAIRDGAGHVARLCFAASRTVRHRLLFARGPVRDLRDQSAVWRRLSSCTRKRRERRRCSVPQFAKRGEQAERRRLRSRDDHAEIRSGHARPQQSAGGGGDVKKRDCLGGAVVQ